MMHKLANFKHIYQSTMMEQYLSVWNTPMDLLHEPWAIHSSIFFFHREKDGKNKYKK
jgi:hypothetical protein